MTRTPRRDPASPPLARAPARVGPSSWVFPEPERADEHGVVGIGADLDPSTLVTAYRSGIFPWPHPGVALPWFTPDPRGIIEPSGLHVSRSLRRRLRGCGWIATVDHDFRAVIAACSVRDEDEGTWITPEMQHAYRRLHELGWAHSVEVWDGEELVGGLYGVQAGGCFTGESMFHRRTDASKVAMVELVSRLVEAGGAFFDVQIVTPHLATLGAVERPRAEFLEDLAEVRDDDVRLRTDSRPVQRHAARLRRRRGPAGTSTETGTGVGP